MHFSSLLLLGMIYSVYENNNNNSNNEIKTARQIHKLATGLLTKYNLEQATE